MTASEIEKIGLPEKPEWLRIYDVNCNAAQVLSKKGFHYNAVGGYKSAIPFLEKAYTLDPHLQDLGHQLAYAYNATMQFEKAITLLIKAIKYYPEDCMLYRELGYALIESDLYDDAERIYESKIPFCDETEQQVEMCLDMLQTYFRLNDRPKFDKWCKLAKQYVQNGSKAINYIAELEKICRKADIKSDSYNRKPVL